MLTDRSSRPLRKTVIGDGVEEAGSGSEFRWLSSDWGRLTGNMSCEAPVNIVNFTGSGEGQIMGQ
jgi:hypothetical protein